LPGLQQLGKVNWGEAFAMLFVFAVALLLATEVFYWAASNVNHGIYWADRLCHEAQSLCNAPWWLLVATAAVVVMSLMRQMTKA
jgi:lysylphosphatidylglycerol synthetase-like protein (DUF2156 family)